MRYNVGGQPGPGQYTCTNCGWDTPINDCGESLPACPGCLSGQNTTYRQSIPREVR